MKTRLFTISFFVVSLALMPGASGTLAQGPTPSQAFPWQGEGKVE